MSFLVPIMMLGWIPFSIILFQKLSHQKATLIIVIGGVLFLPVAAYDMPMIIYNKETAIAVSLLFGMIFSEAKADQAFKPKLIDIPIITWCIISHFLSFLSNDLGPYNAFAAIVQNSLIYGTFYLAGRIYFSDNDSLRELIKGIIIGGLIYVPLVFYEVRMSPQLSNNIYGFFPHSFIQCYRYGGFRPIIFMEHPLMVSMWMSVAFTVSFWLFKSKEIIMIQKIPMFLIILFLLLASLLCKSANGWIYITLGIASYYYFTTLKSKRLFKLLILIIPLYIILRLSGILSAGQVIEFASNIFDPERIQSLSLRLFEEDMFGINALKRPLLGWAWMGRVWPIDIVTRQIIDIPIDALYLIIFCTNGFLGLVSFYAFLILGPWNTLKSQAASINAVVLSIVMIFFIIDSLLNGMVNSVYILIAGTLIGYSDKIRHVKLKEL